MQEFCEGPESLHFCQAHCAGIAHGPWVEHKILKSPGEKLT